MSTKLTRRNKFEKEWLYAQQCWSALKIGAPVPPVPLYQIFEREEGKAEIQVGTAKIDPKRVTCNGVTVFG